MSAVMVTMLLMRPMSILPVKPTLPLAIAYVMIATANKVMVSARKVIRNSCVLDFDRVSLCGGSLMDMKD
jgi:hypothetical protein